MLEGEIVPHRLLIPSASVRGFDGYLTLLASKGLSFCGVRTRFSLVKGFNRSGEERWLVALERERVIGDAATAKRVIAMRRAFAEAMG